MVSPKEHYVSIKRALLTLTYEGIGINHNLARALAAAAAKETSKHRLLDLRCCHRLLQCACVYVCMYVYIYVCARIYIFLVKCCHIDCSKPCVNMYICV